MTAPQFWKSFLALILLSVLGLIAIIPTSMATIQVQLQTLPDAPDLPVWVLGLLSLINPLILLVIAITLGNFFAPRVGFTSYLVQRVTKKQPFWASLKPHLSASVLWGFGLAVVLYLLELIFQPWLPDSLQLSVASRNVISTLSGMLYGGIVEEVMIRWGLMSFIVWLGWRWFQRSKEQPTSGLVWLGILLSSLAFALGHIGATALLAPLTPLVLIRMFVLNGLAGVLFGWLYWKKGLETAMGSHGIYHIGMSIIVWSFGI